MKGRATCRQNFLPSGSSSQILPVVPPSFSSWSDVFPSEFITIIHLFLTYVRSRHLSQARPGQKIDPDEQKGRSSCRRQNYCVMLMFDAVALIGRHMLQSLADTHILPISRSGYRDFKSSVAYPAHTGEEMERNGPGGQEE